MAAIRKAGTIDVTTAGTMERWFTKAYRDREAAGMAGICNMYRRTPYDGYLGCATAIRNMDLRADGPKIACPTLIIVGEEDPSTPVASAEALNKSIKGSTLKVIPNAAHIAPIEQADAVTRALGDFLAAQKG
jgi:3-oxoadipate enol-lactonase